METEKRVAIIEELIKIQKQKKGALKTGERTIYPGWGWRVKTVGSI